MQHAPLPETARAFTRARTPMDPASLARAAQSGDVAAQSDLVRVFDARLRRVVGGFGLCPSDVDDVLQSTWLGALTSLHTLKSPDAVGAWLSITARRHALRRLQRRVREVLHDEVPEAESAEPPLDVLIASDHEHMVLWAAIATLPPHQRRLVVALLEHPDASYAEIGALVGIPVGAIGPTRSRAIARLRKNPRILALRGKPDRRFARPALVA